MKTTKELLRLLLLKIAYGNVKNVGMCEAMSELHREGYLSKIEYTYIYNYIKKNRNISQQYFDGRGDGYSYWWPKREKEPRIKFLQYLIDHESR